MTRVPTPFLGRRATLLGGAAAAVGLVFAPGARAQTPLFPTPRQTPGPFYPTDWTGDTDWDLVQVQGALARALGRVAHVRGRVLDIAGSPVANAVVEIWQADNAGRYNHPRDQQTGRDPGFQGRGRVTTGPDGTYSFRTIRPVAYQSRTPHIHFAIAAPNRERLVTQLFVAGEPLNDRDGLFNALQDARQRAAVVAPFEPADRIEAGALLASFDIVLG